MSIKQILGQNKLGQAVLYLYEIHDVSVCRMGDFRTRV